MDLAAFIQTHQEKASLANKRRAFAVYEYVTTERKWKDTVVTYVPSLEVHCVSGRDPEEESILRVVVPVSGTTCAGVEEMENMCREAQRQQQVEREADVEVSLGMVGSEGEVVFVAVELGIMEQEVSKKESL